MPESLQTLLTVGSERELCSGVYDLILQHHGEDVGAAELSEVERAVLLTQLAEGVVGNGGFQYLFEGSIKDDPDYQRTAAAFAAVGCTGAAEAFEKALALFPDGKPPRDTGERLKAFRRGAPAQRGAINHQFWDAARDLDRFLAAYIREHAAELAHLDGPARERPPKPAPPEETEADAQDEPQEDSGFSVADALDGLPHWACVAFAGRCARAALPHFEAAWPEAPAKRKQELARAVELVERSAASARRAKALRDAEVRSCTNAGAALAAEYGVRDQDETPPADGSLATIASLAAKAVEKAACAANTHGEESRSAALEALDYAVHVGCDRDELLGDLSRLVKAARDQGWDDVQPVPPSFFDSDSDAGTSVLSSRDVKYMAVGLFVWSGILLMGEVRHAPGAFRIIGLAIAFYWQLAAISLWNRYRAAAVMALIADLLFIGWGAAATLRGGPSVLRVVLILMGVIGLVSFGRIRRDLARENPTD